MTGDDRQFSVTARWFERRGDEHVVVAPGLEAAAHSLSNTDLSDYTVVVHLERGQTRDDLAGALRDIGIDSQAIEARLEVREVQIDPLGMSADELRYVSEVAQRTLFIIDNGLVTPAGREFTLKELGNGKWSFNGLSGFSLSELQFGSDAVDVMKLMAPFDSREEAMDFLQDAFRTWGWIVREK